MTREINTWHIDEGYTATFGQDDFESWWLAGRTRSDQVSPTDVDDLIENCIYLAEAESRAMTQTLSDLRESIETWATQWNETTNA